MKIDIAQHAEFSKYIKDGMRQAVYRALLSTAARLVNHITTDLIPNNKPFQPVDRGIYRAGWRVRQHDATMSVEIINAVPHSVFIDEGVKPENVKPGKAMITALTAWVKRKGLGHKSSIKTRKVIKLKGDEAKNMAWAIAMSMKKKGIFAGRALPPGYGILRRAMNRFDPFFRIEMDREMKKIQ